MPLRFPTLSFLLAAVSFTAGFVAFPMALKVHERYWKEECASNNIIQITPSKTYAKIFVNDFGIDDYDLISLFREIGVLDKSGKGLRGIYFLFRQRVATSGALISLGPIRIAAIDLDHSEYADCHTVYQELRQISPNIAPEVISTLFRNGILSPTGNCPRPKTLSSLSDATDTALIKSVNEPVKTISTVEYSLHDYESNEQFGTIKMVSSRESWLDSQLIMNIPEISFISSDCGPRWSPTGFAEPVAKNIVDLITGRNSP